MGRDWLAKQAFQTNIPEATGFRDGNYLGLSTDFTDFTDEELKICVICVICGKNVLLG
jgi:hypothetical protein